MSTLSRASFAKVRTEVFNLSYNIAESSSAIANDVARLDYIFNKAKTKPNAEQQETLEMDILLGKVCQYLKKVANRELTLAEAYALKNSKEKTKAEENAFVAARQHKSVVLRRANIKHVDKRGGKKGRPEGTTNAPKVVTFKAKAGATLTPECPDRSALVAFLAQEAAILDAMRIKHQNMEGIEDIMNLIKTFYEDVKAIENN